MRLFIGIRVPPEIRESLMALWSSLPEPPTGLRMDRLESLHLTFAFLGDVSAQPQEALERLIVRAVERPPKGSFSITRFESFPPKKPTLLTARLHEEGALTWKPFVERLRDMVSVAAPHVDRKPWIPHITMARSAKGSSLPAWSSPIPPISWKPTNISLILSKPGPAGSIYTDLHVFPLNI